MAHDPQYCELNFFLGVSDFGENDPNQAIRSFELELGTLKPHPRCRYYLALALQAAGQIDESISQLNRTVAENPKDADALYQLARIYKNASIQAIDRKSTRLNSSHLGISYAVFCLKKKKKKEKYKHEWS